MKNKSIVMTILVAGLFMSQIQALPYIKRPIKEVIAEQETAKGIPQGLLRAIAKVESGLSPWVVNAKGRGHRFSSKEDAVQFIKRMVQNGYTNFSVGCMQLHYASHRCKFKSVEAMIEPENNIAHAARLIKRLERRTGSLERAVKLYHSPTPVHHNRYKRKVYGAWAKLGGFETGELGESLKTIAYKSRSQQKPKIKKKPIRKTKKAVRRAAQKRSKPAQKKI